MGQSLSAVYLHLVFSTQDRQPFLLDPDLRRSVHAYLATVSNDYGCPAILVGGVEDHVHLLARFGRQCTQSDWAKKVKATSSHWLNNDEPNLPEFKWQAGFGIFSVSPREVESVRRYIENQEEHHRKFSFKDEFRALLTENEVEWDEKYVWL